MSTESIDLLADLATKYGSDKFAHRYTKFYSQKFQAERFRVKKVLELGVSYGASMRMWCDYFPNAMIFGVDIHGDAKTVETGRIRVEIADISQKGDLDRILTTVGSDIDIIIDDASHYPNDQIVAFEALFPALREGGYYVIEDMYPSYFGDEGVAYFKSLINKLYYWDATRKVGYSFGSDADWWSKNILSIEFYRFITFILKGDATKSSC